jgi:hypothetical protein
MDTNETLRAIFKGLEAYCKFPKGTTSMAKAIRDCAEEFQLDAGKAQTLRNVHLEYLLTHFSSPWKSLTLQDIVLDIVLAHLKRVKKAKEKILQEERKSEFLRAIYVLKSDLQDYLESCIPAQINEHPTMEDVSSWVSTSNSPLKHKLLHKMHLHFKGS